MKKLLLSEYLKSPCSTSSIPFWKYKNLTIPDNLKIVHDSNYVESNFLDYIDEPYFRLYHNLESVKQADLNNIDIVVATTDLLNNFISIINASYSDLSVTEEQIKSFLKFPVYCPDLWVLLKDKSTDIFIGCGIADYDKKVGELIMEWIQVLPLYRGRGYGYAIVNHLLKKMQGTAKFATVSGRVNNPTNAERLYRKCGFVGNDVWHILCKKS